MKSILPVSYTHLMWTNQIKNSETENTIGQWTVLGGVVSGADSFNGISEIPTIRYKNFQELD